MKSALAILAATIALTGCSAPRAVGERFTDLKRPEAGQTMLYVYRPAKSFGSAIVYDVSLNDKAVGYLRHGGFIETQVKPGTYELSGTTTSKHSVTVNLKPDEIQCVKAGLRAGAAVGTPSFLEVPLDQCRREIADTNKVN